MADVLHLSELPPQESGYVPAGKIRQHYQDP
jgi:hypothetical protein